MNGIISKYNLAFKIENNIEVTYIEVPKGSTILKADNENNQLYFYILTTDSKKMETLKIVAYRNNIKYDFAGSYIDSITITYKFEDLIYHFFVE